MDAGTEVPQPHIIQMPGSRPHQKWATFTGILKVDSQHHRAPMPGVEENSLTAAMRPNKNSWDEIKEFFACRKLLFPSKY